MKLKIPDYSPLPYNFWTGRIDDPDNPETFRWHQVVQIINLEENLDVTKKGFCILGFACDKGVEKNMGRIGTAKGPISIRKELFNLPDNYSGQAIVYDAGNIYCTEGDLEKAQNALIIAVNRILDLNLFPIILGGGHEIAFGHYFGILKNLKKSKFDPNKLGIINFDAHFDLRPNYQGSNSGTMFREIANYTLENKFDFNYLCLGVQKTANTKSLFKTAENLGVNYILEKNITEENYPETCKEIDKFIEKYQKIYLTVCADVFSSAFAPGVSSPQPFGMHPEITLRLIKYILKTGKILSFDIAEVSPRFDEDNQTAKLAAIIIYAVVNTLINPEEEN